MSKPEYVTGFSSKRRYPLGKLLGRGGQGAVFAVKNEPLAVKVVSRAQGFNRERLRDQMAMIRRLPLDDLPIAKPIECLQPPFVGYVMELFTGMMPFQRLMRPHGDIDSVLKWYLDGGGLKRRLRLLAKIAGILSQLHGKGLIYVDLSPANVFVSEDPAHNEVRLIDTDNMRASTTSGRTFYTPSYGAPELVQAKGFPSTLSDAYSFAVLCFETLSLQHPFKGDHVVYGEPEIEEQAFAGQLPWIDHGENDLNRSNDGIPREFVLTRSLRENFQKTFEDGLHNPSCRPGLAQWSEHLHEAADRTISCASCCGGYYFNNPMCPWCDESRPPFVIAAVHLWDPNRRALNENNEYVSQPGIAQKNGKHNLLGLQIISQGCTSVITRRLTHGVPENDEPIIQLDFNGEFIDITPLVDGLYLRLNKERQTHLISGKTTRLSARYEGTITIHTGTTKSLHRLILLDLKKARG